MNKSTEKISNSNVSMSKTNYDKALQHYNLSGKNLSQATKKLDFKPTTKIAIKGLVKYKPMTVNNPAYENRFKDFLIRKWKDDTEEYVANYKMNWTKFNSGKKNETIMTNISVRGTKNNIKNLAILKFEDNKRKFESASSAVNGSFEFDDEPSSFVPMTSSKPVMVENQRVESSASGGQRNVGKGGRKKNTKVRDAFAFFKISEDNEEWNTHQGKCVFDYLYWTYKDVVGFKKILGKGREYADEFLNNLFIGDEPDEQNPLIQGVSVNQLEKFCDLFGVNMYAYDKSDDLIEGYKSKKQSGKKALIFTIFDDHFYPIDESERRSKQAIATASIRQDGKVPTTFKIKSNDIDDYVLDKQKDEVLKEVIAPTEEEFNALKGDKSDYLSVQNKYALDYFKKNEGKIPFPIKAKNVVVMDATIDTLIYDDKIVLTKPINPYVKQFFDDYSTGFQGQTALQVGSFVWDGLYSCKINKAPFLSQTNQQVAEVLNAENIKWRTHIGKISDAYSADTIKDLLVKGEAIAVDITKCYCDALYNQREDFIVFKGKETVEKYDGEPLTLGLYFVETDDMTLFHQSNWYSRVIIDVAKRDNIEFTITRQIRCVDEDWYWNKTVEEVKEEYTEIVITEELNNKNLFKLWIDDVIRVTEQDGDYTLTKFVINAMTGFLGKTKSVSKKVGLSKNLQEIWDDFLIPEVQNNPDLDVYLNTIESGEDKIYLYGITEKTLNLSNGLPMYLQILDWSNIALYNLGKDVGGEVIYRKTDCIISIGGKFPDKTLEEGSSYQDTFGKYHLEPVEKAIHYNLDLVMRTDRKVLTPEVEDSWIDYDFNSSDDWENIVKTAIEKGGMMIAGRAGTGKSYVIGKGIEAGLLPETREARLAFTNRAARNINGTTVHKAMALNSGGLTNVRTIQHLKSIPVFVVDEISMLNSFMWNKLMLLKEMTGAIFIIMGDFRQCQPIEIGVQIDYFSHPYCKRLANYNRCELKEPQRYDENLWDWLEQFYNYGNEGAEIEKKKVNIESILYSKNLVYTHQTRTNINNLCMAEMIKTKNYLVLDLPEKGLLNKYAEKVFIYKGLPVMAKTGIKEDDIINSDEFIVEDFSSADRVMTLIRDDEPSGEIITVEFSEFHKKFVANYAATVHSSQGATITRPIIIWDWNFMNKYSRNIGYTAVSRAKNCEQVKICYNFDF